MKSKQIEALGVPHYCISKVISGIQKVAKDGDIKSLNIKETVLNIMKSPESYVDDKYFGDFAQEFILERDFVKPVAPYNYWGTLDQNVEGQLETVRSMPGVVQISLMADSHYCPNIPVGSVVAMENAVSPEIVSSDISCMMYCSVLDIPTDYLKNKYNLFHEAIQKSTRFGYDCHDQPINHSIFDEDWSITKITERRKELAREQLGSSGSSNHFVDIGILSFNSNFNGLEANKEYVAILSHSGSRGIGASVADYYSQIAHRMRPNRYNYLGGLAWLDMDTEAGQEYWLAMNFMGEYAEANHEVIHKLITKNLGSHTLEVIKNKHNFAWKENINGKDLYVHRKGATPAGNGVIGIIPGSMASPAFIVSGKGNTNSLCSASHGAGRLMSRKKAKELYNWKSVKNNLEARGIRVISAGADECPMAYKNIEEVMEAQSDLVDILGKFEPKIVKMAEDTTGYY